MVIKIRVRCPLCHMMPGLDYLKQEHNITDIVIIEQEFGGRIKGERSATGKPIGLIKYTELENPDPELKAEVKAVLKKRLMQAKKVLE